MLDSTQASTPWITHPWVAEGERSIRFGVVLVGQRSTWSPVFDWVRRLENLGFNSIWAPDHPMIGMDAWTTLSAIAARGTSLRLGPLVSCISYRSPALLARLAADVDCLSEGKLVAVGTYAGSLFLYSRNGTLQWQRDTKTSALVRPVRAASSWSTVIRKPVVSSVASSTGTPPASLIGSG